MLNIIYGTDTIAKGVLKSYWSKGESKGKSCEKAMLIYILFFTGTDSIHVQVVRVGQTGPIQVCWYIYLRAYIYRYHFIIGASLPIMLADPFISLTAGASGSRTDDSLFPFRLRQTITIIMTTAMATTIVDTMIMIKYFVAKPPLPFVASVVGGWPAHVLSGLGLHSLFFMPRPTHSLIFSSFPSEQQAEHSWQLWTVLLMKYPCLHFPLHAVSFLLVHSASFISCSAQWWQALQEDESYLLENVWALQERHSDIGGWNSLLPHGGYSPYPSWHLPQDRHLLKVPFE